MGDGKFPGNRLWFPNLRKSLGINETTALDALRWHRRCWHGKGGCYQWLPIPTNSYQWLLSHPPAGWRLLPVLLTKVRAPEYLKALIGFNRLD